MSFDSRRYYDVDNATQAQAEWIRSALEKGYRVDLITIQFRQLPVHGDCGVNFERQRLRQMQAQAQRLFSAAQMRYVRNSRDVDMIAARAPQFIIFPDYPVGKRAKRNRRLVDPTVNGGGLHLHVICIQPSLSRKDQTIEGVIKSLDWILKSDMTSIHVQQVTETPGKMSSYMLKGVRRGRFDIDDVLIFPRAISELGPVQERNSGLMPSSLPD